MTISETPRKTPTELRDESIAASGATIYYPYTAHLSSGLMEIMSGGMSTPDVGFFAGADPSPWSVELTSTPWMSCDLSRVYSVDANGKPLFEITALDDGIWYQSSCTSMQWFQLSCESLWADLVWYVV